MASGFQVMLLRLEKYSPRALFKRVCGESICNMDLPPSLILLSCKLIWLFTHQHVFKEGDLPLFTPVQRLGKVAFVGHWFGKQSVLAVVSYLKSGPGPVTSSLHKLN